MNNPNIVIVGSGASGLAAATTLVKNGFKPTIIDSALGGKNPNLVQHLKMLKPYHSTASKKSPGRKTWFGSDFPYRSHPESKLILHHLDPVPTYSFGGYSRIWGAACSFYKDLDSWPSKYGLTDEDCLLVANLLGFQDATLTSMKLKHTQLAYELLEFFSIRRLNDRFHSELSNLAINNQEDEEESCQYCNKCLSGCPYGSIWWSGAALEKMFHRNEVNLKLGLFLEKVDYTQGQPVKLILKNEKSQQIVYETDYLFLATGAISTAEILIRSQILEKLTLKDSSTAFSAFLNFNRKRRQDEQKHSLSQLWITDKKNRAHFQIYSSTPDLEQKIHENLPRFLRAKWIINWISKRISPVISYLPSEKSGVLNIELNQGKIEVTAHRSLKSKFEHHRVLLGLSFILLLKGYVMPSFLSKIPEPGHGYHFGSSLPMGLESNNLGQIDGIDNMSIVDSSILPFIEAGSITPTVMVNAARIARQVCQIIR